MAKAVKVGDTVRVVLEGPVTSVDDGGFGVGGDQYNNWISEDAGHVKLIDILTPPVQVGDEIASDEIDDLPVGTILLSGEGKYTAAWRRNANGDWYRDGSEDDGKPSFPAIVLHLPMPA